jgi:hypothetical protein
MLLALTTATVAQRRRDPLTEPEVDQLRDAAIDAQTRLKLYVDFARDRLTKVEQANSETKMKDRPAQVHDRLQDFLDVYDELNDNVDNFEKRGDDLRKPLKLVIEADGEFRTRLQAVKQAADLNSEDAKAYEFLLSDVMDTVQASLKDHREMLTEQQAAAKSKKK